MSVLWASVGRVFTMTTTKIRRWKESKNHFLGAIGKKVQQGSQVLHFLAITLLIHVAGTQSRPLVITIFTLCARLPVLTFSKLNETRQIFTASRTVNWLSGSLKTPVLRFLLVSCYFVPNAFEKSFPSCLCKALDSLEVFITRKNTLFTINCC